MSLNYDALFREMSQRPEVRKAVQDKAVQLRDAMERRWPEVNEISDSQRARLEKNEDHTILITSVTSDTDGRPLAIVTVRHPRAVAEQASTGFATRAVKDVT